jgi:hypothetical protein
MIAIVPLTSDGSIERPSRIAASIPVYSAAWMPAVIRKVGPGRAPVMLKYGHSYRARCGSS